MFPAAPLSAELGDERKCGPHKCTPVHVQTHTRNSDVLVLCWLAGPLFPHGGGAPREGEIEEIRMVE